MKYWYLELSIQNGEYEHSSLSVHKTRAGAPDFDAEAYANDFYAEGEDLGNGHYSFDCGCVIVYVNQCREIDKSEYKVLSLFI